MTQIVWYRSDLRVADHRPLRLALATNEPVIALFIATPKQWHAHNIGTNKRDFLYRNLQTLAVEIENLGAHLCCLEVANFADAIPALVRFSQRAKANRILWHREFGWDERQRDIAAGKQLHKVGIETEICDDRCLINPEFISTGGGTPYKVFTPFKRNWLRQLRDAWQLPLALPNPSTATWPPGLLQLCIEHPISQASFFRAAHPSSAQLEQLAVLWPAGEDEAHRRLANFVLAGEQLADYGEARDFPALAGTSGLSPYLSAGVISARQCVALWLQAAAGDWEEQKLGVWLSELAWRDFYHYVMWHFPRVSRNQPFQLKTNAVQWRDSEDDFRAWCEATTGIPIVDAAIRQLLATGWMHNRLRMVVAMFLCKNLLLDWRSGEAFFMQQLIDADFCANNGGWQWSASTGTDAAPYFRVFNPVSQSQRFDANGDFIRHWMPELAHLDKRDIHLPPAAVRGDYPAPIVDLKFSRLRAIEAFAGL